MCSEHGSNVSSMVPCPSADAVRFGSYCHGDFQGSMSHVIFVQGIFIRHVSLFHNRLSSDRQVHIVFAAGRHPHGYFPTAVDDSTAVSAAL